MEIKYNQKQWEQIQQRKENIQRAKEHSENENTIKMLECIILSMKNTLLEKADRLPF